MAILQVVLERVSKPISCWALAHGFEEPDASAFRLIVTPTPSALPLARRTIMKYSHIALLLVLLSAVAQAQNRKQPNFLKCPKSARPETTRPKEFGPKKIGSNGERCSSGDILSCCVISISRRNRRWTCACMKRLLTENTGGN